MADDYLKYITGTQTQIDPYAANPFAEAAPEDEDGATPFAEELPFRFTQFAINPSTEATSGQAGRTPVARSPHTSGSTAAELRALRDKIAGLPSTPPGEMPQMPAGLASPMTIPDVQEAETPDMRWGLPLKEYQVPRQLLSDFPGRNPVDLAVRYNSGTNLQGTLGNQNVDFGKYKDGEMTTVQGYDMSRLLGEDKWNNILSAKTLQDGEDKLYYNLGILPSDINPELDNQEHLISLATRNFADPNRSLILNPELEGGGGPGLGAGSVYGEELANKSQYILDPNYQFDPKDLEYWLRSNPEKSEWRQFSGQWAPTLIKAGAAAVIGQGVGGALGATFGLGSGAGAAAGAAPSAGGLAGMAGMSPGVAATGVNLVGNAAMSVGAQKALEEAGIPMDSPLAQLIVGIGGATIGGLGSNLGGSSVGDYTTQAGLEATAASQNISVDELVNQISAGEYTSGADWLNFQQTSIADAINAGGKIPVIMQQPDGSIGNVMVDPSSMNPSQLQWIKDQGSKFSVGQLQSGLSSFQNATAPSPGTGADQYGMYDPNMDPVAMAQYENEMTAYNQALEEYNKRLRLQDKYEQKMSEFMKRSNAYNTYQELRSRQQGLSSQLAAGIAENPFYDPDENLSGIQSQLF